MKFVQAVLTKEEYEAFADEAKRKGLSIKKAAGLALTDWVEREGRVFIRGVGKSVLQNPLFENWQEFFCTDYAPPKKETLFFSSCFWGKPFHESWIFRKIKDIVSSEEVHFVVLSSAGLVPYEYWDAYPFNSYDSDPWKFSPQDREAFVEINGRRVESYLEKNGGHYKKIIAYLPQNDAALKALRKGYDASSCHLPFFEVENIESEEGARNEDYYACLAREENLAKLKRKLEEIG